MDPQEVLSVVTAWEPLIALAVNLGVKSFEAIRALLHDADADDDAVLAALAPKWDALYSDVERASRGPS